MTRSFEDYVKTAGAYTTPQIEDLSPLRYAGRYLKAHPWKSGLAAVGVLGAGALAKHFLGKNPEASETPRIPEEMPISGALEAPRISEEMPISGALEAPRIPEEVPVGAIPDFAERGLTQGVAGLITEGTRALGRYAHSALKRSLQGREHRRVFEQVTAIDPILAEADPGMLQQSYKTMTRFAPTLATDPFAVQSFLREAVTSGGGINYNTLKLLADAERSTQST